MKLTHLALIVLVAALTAACATPEKKTETGEAAPAAKPVPAKPAPAKVVPKPAPAPAPAAEIVTESGVPAAAPEAETAVKPVRGVKFARLKIGMTLKQVEKLIGRPARQWQHPTSKVSIPFYFGPDRWVIQYAYKGEGVLTFNSGGEQLLTQIDVNRAE